MCARRFLFVGLIHLDAHEGALHDGAQSIQGG
jgi:hypothetical protein